MKNPNTNKFWDKLIIKSQKDLFKSQIYIDKNKIVLKYLKKISGRLLDIGIGYGYIEGLLIDSKSKLSFYGIDISKESIKQLNKKFIGDFRISQIYKIPFLDNFFDSVIILDVLEHLPQNNVLKAYKEVYRVLKSKGLLIISVPLNDSLRDKELNGHLREYTPDIIQEEISRSGFIIKNTHLLYAFRNMYFLKTLFLKFFPISLKKPNLIIVVAQKK